MTDPSTCETVNVTSNVPPFGPAALIASITSLFLTSIPSTPYKNSPFSSKNIAAAFESVTICVSVTAAASAFSITTV